MGVQVIGAVEPNTLSHDCFAGDNEARDVEAESVCRSTGNTISMPVTLLLTTTSTFRELRWLNAARVVIQVSTRSPEDRQPQPQQRDPWLPLLLLKRTDHTTLTRSVA